MKIMWLDTETTGLNKEKCDIIQLAGIIIIDGEEKERFNFHIQPVNYENIESEALMKTNITIEKLKTFELPQEVFQKFKNMLAKYIDKYNKDDKFYLAGHNVQFDLEFLKSFFNKQEDTFFGSWFYYHTIDLMAFANILHTAGLIYFPNKKLETIAQTLKIPVGGELHDAMIDIDITRRCFCRLAAKYLKFE